MSKYLVQAPYTPAGHKGLREVGGPARRDTATALPRLDDAAEAAGADTAADLSAARL